jgi:hypothetical protein
MKAPWDQFQIDGNFGFVSDVTEMLWQSHTGIVHLLPALPSAIPNGSVEGLVARGNFVVDIAWKESALTSVNITSPNGGDLQLRYANGSAIAVNGDIYQGSISTFVNATYYVTLSEN